MTRIMIFNVCVIIAVFCMLVVVLARMDNLSNDTRKIQNDVNEIQSGMYTGRINMPVNDNSGVLK